MLRYARVTYFTSCLIIFPKITVSFTPAIEILFLLNLLASGLFLMCYFSFIFTVVHGNCHLLSGGFNILIDCRAHLCFQEYILESTSPDSGTKDSFSLSRAANLIFTNKSTNTNPLGW